MDRSQNLQFKHEKNSAIESFQTKSIVWKDFVSYFNRVTMFVVFFWFGYLKVISISPAEELVSNLHAATIQSLISKQNFLILLGVTECVIGILWLIPRFTIVAFWLFAIQIVTTFLPFIFLSNEIVHHGFELSLTGQYIVKNLVLISCALTIYCDYTQKCNNKISK